jgi:hypothetical protein
MDGDWRILYHSFKTAIDEEAEVVSSTARKATGSIVSPVTSSTGGRYTNTGL